MLPWSVECGVCVCVCVCYQQHGRCGMSGGAGGRYMLPFSPSSVSCWKRERLEALLSYSFYIIGTLVKGEKGPPELQFLGKKYGSHHRDDK